MSTITTVRGPIAPEELGVTSGHEHMNIKLELLDHVVKQYGAVQLPPRMLELRVDNLAFLRDGASVMSKECESAGDLDFAVAELNAFKAVGGSAVCDATPIGGRGDVTLLAEASEKSGVHVVCSTGLYVDGARPERFVGMTEDEQHAFFLSEATDGIDGTGIRPGMLKCGTSAQDPTAPLFESEVTTLRALGRVSAETGLSLHVHTAFPMSAAQVLAALDVALSTGMEPDRLVMLHMDSFLRPWDGVQTYIGDPDAVLTVDTSLQREVLSRGVNIGFDSWAAGTPILPSDNDRLKGLVELLRAGHGDHIILGHDAVTKPQGASWGYYGFTRFAQLVPSTLAQLGFGEDVYRRLVVDTPARILAH